MSSDGNKGKLGRYVRHVGDGSRFTLIQAFACARSGLRYAIRSQRNFKIHSVFALVAIVLSFALQISAPEWCAIVICIALVYALELANTAVESAIDLVSPEWNELAKRAKDCAAAAVYVAALASVVIACIVFIPRACAILGIWG